MRLSPDELFVLQLEQAFDKDDALYMTKEEDFGYNAAACQSIYNRVDSHC